MINTKRFAVSQMEKKSGVILSKHPSSNIYELGFADKSTPRIGAMLYKHIYLI